MSQTDEESMKREVEDLFRSRDRHQDWSWTGETRVYVRAAMATSPCLDMTPENHSLAPIGLGWLSHRLV